MKIVEVKHPLVKHKLGLMRENDISTKRFRELASEVGSLLTYEATADLETEKVTIEGWCGPVEIDQIKGKKITVVPILRAGGLLGRILGLNALSIATSTAIAPVLGGTILSALDRKSVV